MQRIAVVSLREVDVLCREEQASEREIDLSARVEVLDVRANQLTHEEATFQDRLAKANAKHKKKGEDLDKSFVDKEENLRKSFGAKLKEQESRFVKKLEELNAEKKVLQADIKRLVASLKRAQEGRDEARKDLAILARDLNDANVQVGPVTQLVDVAYLHLEKWQGTCV